MINRMENTYIKILPELDEEWSIFIILWLKEILHEELCIVNKVCGRHLKVRHSHWSKKYSPGSNMPQNDIGPGNLLRLASLA